MVSLTSLVTIAVSVAVLAAAVAWLRREGAARALADAGAAFGGALSALVLAVLFFALSYPPDSSTAWGDLGSVALMAGPVACTAALRLRGRRSVPRAFVASTMALAAVVLWLTVHLRGPRGGWEASEIIATTVAGAAAMAAAACLGWWSKRRRPGS
jgi:hypothetical protein